MKTFIFPGQGSQIKGMGGGLFDEFKEQTDMASDILGYSIKDLCLVDSDDCLMKTQFAQPAIYVVNALSLYKRQKNSTEIPDFVAGHSLGEFNALLAAECFDFETGLRLVEKRGALMGSVGVGAMAAVINMDFDEVVSILKEYDFSNIDVANINTPNQIVLSGSIEDIEGAEKCFCNRDAYYIRLNTSGAFHSRYMHSVKEEFLKYLSDFELSNPKIPVISNVTACPYLPKDMKTNLSHQIESSVLWSDTISYLKGVDPNMEFEEIGDSMILTRMLKDFD